MRSLSQFFKTTSICYSITKSRYPSLLLSNGNFSTNKDNKDNKDDAHHKSIEQEAYYNNRIESLQKLHFNYPHFKPTTTIRQFIKKYKHLTIQQNNLQANPIEYVSGRVSSIRTHGKTTFIDIRQQHTKLQIAYKTKHQMEIRRGDIVGVHGKAFVTKKGELSVDAQQCKILSPCLWMLPQYESLRDSETRYRSKHLDLMTNSQSMQTLIKRSKIVSSLRKQLLEEGYLQVETPILSTSCGGALAKPFVTYHNDHKMNLYLRIAPQLDLKKLLIGGIQRVFEIGKNFRNESIDQTHNPQFSTCQLYCSYADYRDMIVFTHKLINNIAKEVNGSTKFISQENTEIDLSEPWEEKDFMESLQKCTNRELPIDFETEQTHKFYSDLCDEYQIPCDEPRTVSRLLDKLASHFLENSLKPFLIKNHPKVMSPLAKPIPEKPYLTQRFQVFINGFEVVNSYTELNMPKVQRQNTPHETDFIQALEYGLPPCAGWGIGIDRLVMLLTHKNRIQQVLAYPLMREKTHKTETQ